MSFEKVIYAQFVIGAPGAGKTTYCSAMHQFLGQVGREVLLVDFDPAHEVNISPYTVLSLSEFITVDQVMRQFRLGPNGALLYCMEWLENHLDLIKTKLMQLLDTNPDCRYIIFDLPGQIELYTNSGSIQNVLQTITNEWKFRTTVVHLTDSVLCLEPSHYISSLLVSLSIMLNLQLPHVNILSKIDLFPQNEGAPNLSRFDGNYLSNIAHQIDRETLYPDDGDEDDNELFDDYYSDEDDTNNGIDDDIGTNNTTNPNEEVTAIDASPSLDKKNRPSPEIIKYLNSFSEINNGIVELIEDYSLVDLTHLSVNDKHTMIAALKTIDRSNGYAFQDIDLQSMKMKNMSNTLPPRQK